VAWTTSELDRIAALARALYGRASDERAQTLSEYAVILTVITITIILAVGLLSTNLGSHFVDIAKLVGP
jgi:Flp pilus assembly pilin Flp